MPKHRFGPVLLFVLLILLAAALSGCGQQGTTPSTGPLFTDPAVKIAALSSQDFTVKLFYEAVALEPKVNQAGVRVS